MLFGDADIEIALRVVPGKPHQPGALAHGRRDADEFLIKRRHVAQPVAEHIGVGPAFFLALHLAGVGVERGYAVIDAGVPLGGFEALAFLGDHVQETRAAHAAHIF